MTAPSRSRSRTCVPGSKFFTPNLPIKNMKMQNSTGHFLSRFFTAIGLGLMTAATVRADYQSTVLGDAPLAYYALNPAADPAGTAPDLSGNGNDGAASNLTAVPGPTAYIPGAAYFDGTNSMVDLSGGGNPGLLDFTGPITLEAWVQPASPSWFGNIIAKGYDADTYQEITLRVNGPYGGNFYANSGSAGVSGGVQTTNWTHVVLSSDGTYASLYVNGTLVQQTADASGAISFADTWRIGNGSSAGAGRWFNGNLSQVAIYNHGLTQAQVLAHYYAGEINASPTTSAPIITVQPQPQSAYVGGSATFSVAVVSAFATTNQWYKNDSPLAGKTNATLTIVGISAADAADYRVVVGNGQGTTNSVTVALALLASGNSLRWSANGNSGVWDTAGTANWINQSNSATTVFNAGDQVLFDDLAGEPTTVAVSGTVSPSSITVNASTNNFLVNGSGTISGAASLTKLGTSTLTLNSAANFTGPVTISGGTIAAGNNSLNAVNSITVANGATLDFAGSAMINGKPISISGAGATGKGAVFNSGGAQYGQVVNFTLAGDATIGGSNRWDLGSGAQIGGAHKLTMDWSAGAGYTEWNTVTVGTNVTEIDLVAGNFGAKNLDAAFQNPATMFDVNTNCELSFWNGGWNGSFHLRGNGRVNLWTAPAAITGSRLILDEGAQWYSWGGGSGDEPVTSAVTLNGVAHFLIGDHNMVYTNVISGPGGFVWDAWNHQLVLAASNTYAGPTVIGNGPQLTLTGDGSITHSALIFFGGNNSLSTHLDATGRPDQTLTLAAGQTLAGVGAVNGNLVVAAGATVAPAGTNTTISITTGANPVGILTAVSDITLNGTTRIKLNGSGVSDQIQSSIGTINYGGTLELVNISGTSLAVGDSFPVFGAAAYAGNFAKVTPATPGPGLGWDLTQLSSGVVGVVPVPVISSTQITGGKFVFSGTGGTANGTYRVLTATNLATPPGNWVPLQTNIYDAAGAFTVTNAIAPNVPRQFYRITQ